MTDLRDAKRPIVFRDPIDLWRNDGATDYSHDVRTRTPRSWWPAEAWRA